MKKLKLKNPHKEIGQSLDATVKKKFRCRERTRMRALQRKFPLLQRQMLKNLVKLVLSHYSEIFPPLQRKNMGLLVQGA